MSINLVKGNKIRVLVAAPHNEVKNETIEAWIERVKNFTFKNFNFKTDVLIVDNSESPKNKKWLMKQGVNCIHIRPKQKTNQKYIAESQDMIRTYALRMKYDFVLFVETDVFPPHDIIERLLVHRKTVVSAMYMIEFGDKSHLMLQGIENLGGTIKNTINIDEGHDIQFVDGQLKEVYACGMGCMLIHKSVLEQVKFRWEEGSDAHADSFLAGDLKFLNIKQFLDTGTWCEHQNSSWATITDRALK